MRRYARSEESRVLRTKGKIGCVNNRLQVQIWPVTHCRHRGCLSLEELYNKTINTIALVAAWYSIQRTLQCECAGILPEQSPRQLWMK
jgi:hypothetical protein